MENLDADSAEVSASAVDVSPDPSFAALPSEDLGASSDQLETAANTVEPVCDDDPGEMGAVAPPRDLTPENGSGDMPEDDYLTSDSQTEVATAGLADAPTYVVKTPIAEGVSEPSVDQFSMSAGDNELESQVDLADPGSIESTSVSGEPQDWGEEEVVDLGHDEDVAEFNLIDAAGEASPEGGDVEDQPDAGVGHDDVDPDKETSGVADLHDTAMDSEVAEHSAEAQDMDPVTTEFADAAKAEARSTNELRDEFDADVDNLMTGDAPVREPHSERTDVEDLTSAAPNDHDQLTEIKEPLFAEDLGRKGVIDLSEEATSGGNPDHTQQIEDLTKAAYGQAERAQEFNELTEAANDAVIPTDDLRVTFDEEVEGTLTRRVPDHQPEVEQSERGVTDATDPDATNGQTDDIDLRNSPHNAALATALAERGLELEAIDRFDFSDNPILNYRQSAPPEDIAYAVNAWNNEIAPGIAGGAIREDFEMHDRTHGLEGHQRLAEVYDYFLGSDAIKSGGERDDGSLDVTGGRHRLEQARLNGVSYLPVRKY